MNRRKFLGLLALAIPAIKYAPVLAKIAPAPTAYQTYVVGQNAVIGEWNDYSNFSEFVLSKSIDEQVAKAAAELGYEAGKHVETAYKFTFSSK